MTDQHDPCEYVRKRYDMPWLRVGVRVVALGRLGTVTGAHHHIKVQHDGDWHDTPYHPSDVRSLEDYGL